MHVLRATALVCFLLMLSVSMIYPVVKHYVMDVYGASVAQAGMFVAVNLLAYAIFAPIWGALSDRAGRRRGFILVGLAGNSAMLLLQANAPSLEWLIAFRLVEGIFTVMVYSTAMALVLDVCRRERYGRGLGLVGMGIAGGMAFGTPAGGAFGELSPVMPFYAASLIIFLTLLFSWRFLEEVPVEGSTSARRSIRRVLGRKELLVPYSFSFIDRFTAGFFVSVFPIMLGTRWGMSPGEIGAYMSAFMLPFALLQYFGGVLADRLGRVKPLAAGSAVYAACIGSIGMLSPPAILLPLGVAGVMASVMLPASAALSGDLAPRGSKGAAIGGFNLSGSLGFALGPAVAGAVAQAYGFSATFLLAGASVLVFLGIALLLLRAWGISPDS